MVHVRGRGTRAGVCGGCVSVGDFHDRNISKVFVRKFEMGRKNGGGVKTSLKGGVTGVPEIKVGGAFRCQIGVAGVGVVCPCLRGSGLAHADDNDDDDDSNILHYKELSSLLYKRLYMRTKCEPRVGPYKKMIEGRICIVKFSDHYSKKALHCGEMCMTCNVMYGNDEGK